MKKIMHKIIIVGIFALFSLVLPTKSVEAVTLDASWTVIDTSNAGTDIGATIQGFLDLGKNKIYIANGTYSSSTTVQIGHDNAIIMGESKTGTQIHQSNDGISFKLMANEIELSNFTIQNPYQFCIYQKDSDKVHVHDMILQGGDTGNSVLFFAGIEHTTSDYESIVAMTTALSMDNVIENNEIWSNKGNDAVYITNQDACKYKRNTLHGGRLAFYLNRNSTVENNQFLDSRDNGIRIAVPGYKNTIKNNIITNTVGSGIAVVKYDANQADSIRGTNLTIENNQITNTQYFGIECSRTDSSTIAGNTITNVRYSGIYLVYNNGIDVKNNVVLDSNADTFNSPSSAWDANLSAGIFADYDVKNCIFEGNQQINEKNNCPYGIRIQQDPTNTGNQILNNLVKGYFTEDFKYPTGTILNVNNVNQLQAMIPTPVLQTQMTNHQIELHWAKIPGYDSYDIEKDGVVSFGITQDTYLDTGLSANTTYKYRIRIPGGFWSSLILVTTYSYDIPVSLQTQHGAYDQTWENTDITATASLLCPYTKFQYTNTPYDESSWQDMTGTQVTFSNNQQSKTYYIRALDATSVVLAESEGFCINLDKELPTIYLSSVPIGYVNHAITTVINKTAGISGVKNVSVVKNTLPAVDITSSTTYQITENGSYRFIITSNANSVSEFDTNITNIDEQPISLVVTPSSTAWTNRDVMLNCTPQVGISGISSLEISKDEGQWENITQESAYSVNQNGTYQFRLTNQAQTSIVKDIPITNIDKSVPTIQLKEVNTGILNRTIIEISMNTGASGLKQLKEAKDNEAEQDITGKNSVPIEENGTYTFWMTNHAGSESLAQIKIVDIKSQDVPVIPIEPVIPSKQVNPDIPSEVSQDNPLLVPLESTVILPEQSTNSSEYVKVESLPEIFIDDVQTLNGNQITFPTKKSENGKKSEETSTDENSLNQATTNDKGTENTTENAIPKTLSKKKDITNGMKRNMLLIVSISAFTGMFFVFRNIHISLKRRKK